jgi:hypothetical protein
MSGINTMSKTSTPTLITYTEWQAAYDFFNKELFSGQLPECVIILDSKQKRTLGYFTPNRYENEEEGLRDELAMNPARFRNRSLIEVLSTLVHEMCHVWQQHFGDKKSLRTYHNREWGAKMESLGLMPSNTGLPGGKKTGQQMTHYIIKGGPFENACKRLLANKFKISWAEAGAVTNGGISPKKKGNSKCKYTCEFCGTAVWGKPNLRLICGLCQTAFQMEQ